MSAIAVLSDLELEAIHCTLHRLERRWTPASPDNPDCHAYDSLPIAMFLPGIRVAERETEGRRFLDVGCGIGTKLALMVAMGWQVAGIDQHEPYVREAQDLVPEATITVADAFELGWFDADLVYMYRPMRSNEDEDALERHVIERMEPGTLLFLPVREPAVEMEPLGESVWRRF